MKPILRMSILPVIGLILVSGTAWALQAGITLTMDEKIVSTDVQTIKGRVYIPISDVAKVLNKSVVKKNGVYSLMPALTGAQRDGRPGNVGVELFSGPWRLKVVNVQQVATYSPLYGSDKEPILPKEAGDVLAVIRGQLKNGTKEMQEVSFDQRSSGNTALMDGQDRGYVPLAYDTRNSGYTSAKMPPGTMLDFVVLFSVPKGANLTTLTYTVKGMEMDKSRDFRVSLTP